MSGHLVIVRGPSRSGKSTFAKKAYPTYKHLESDALFMVGGEYRFDPKKLSEYHTIVQNETRNSLWRGENVIVSNTMTQMWELQPYLEMPYSQLTVFRMMTDINECLRRTNAAQVPDSVIHKMFDRMQDYSGEFKISL
jgi:predicted kinase